MRRHLGQEGLKRITDIRLDDLYVFSDGDEIPKLEILLFLKIYDGIPQLVALHNIWAIFGFFWQVDPAIYGGGIHYTNTVLTVQFFRDFYQYDASRIRTDDYSKEVLKKKIFYQNIIQRIHCKLRICGYILYIFNPFIYIYFYWELLIDDKYHSKV